MKEQHLPFPTDLAALGSSLAREGRLLVLMFSTPGCPWCLVVRRNYLTPMLAEETRLAGAPRVRELMFSEAQPLRDWEGKATTSSEFSNRYRIRLAPTLYFFGPRGELLADPLEGGDNSGLYGDVLARRLEDARLERRKLG